MRTQVGRTGHVARDQLLGGMFVIRAIVDQAQLMVFGNVVVHPQPKAVAIAMRTPPPGRLDMMHCSIIQRMTRILARRAVGIAMAVLIEEVHAQLVPLILHDDPLAERRIVVLVPREVGLSLPRHAVGSAMFQDDVDDRAAQLHAGGRHIHHLHPLDPACG